MPTKPRGLMRVTINLKTEMVEQIEKFANDNSLSRTGAISVLLGQALKNERVISDLTVLVDAIKQEQGKDKSV